MNARPRLLGYREVQILQLAADDLAERGVVRSYDAIAFALGMSSKSGVCNVVSRLERRGLLRRIGGFGRRPIISAEWNSQ